MFFGSVPTDCIEQLFKILDFDRWRSCYVCCSGSFKIERALRSKFRDLPLYSNDVSLYSTAIGSLAAGRHLEFRFARRLEFVEDVLAGDDDPLLRLGALLVSSEMGRYARKNPHAVAHFNHYVASFPSHLSKARADLAMERLDEIETESVVAPAAEESTARPLAEESSEAQVV